MFSGGNKGICFPTEHASLLFRRLKTWQQRAADNLITEHCLQGFIEGFAIVDRLLPSSIVTLA